MLNKDIDLFNKFMDFLTDSYSIDVDKFKSINSMEINSDEDLDKIYSLFYSHNMDPYVLFVFWIFRLGDMNLVELLFKYDYNINSFDNVAIISSAQYGHFELTKILLDKGANASAKNNSPIRFAAKENRLEIVKLLLDRGVNPSIVCSDKLIMDQLIDQEYYDMLKLLCCTDTDPKMIHFVLKQDNMKLMKQLIKHNVEIKLSELFIEIVSNGSINFVKLAINEWDISNELLNIALPIASAHGHYDIVKILIKKGADVQTQNNQSLVLSSGSGHAMVVKYLLKKGADINANQNESLINAFDGNHFDTLQVLIKNGADLSARNFYVLTNSIKNKNFVLVDYIIDKIKKQSKAK